MEKVMEYCQHIELTIDLVLPRRVVYFWYIQSGEERCRSRIWTKYKALLDTIFVRAALNAPC